MLPVEKDAMVGVRHVERLACIYAMVGDSDKAIDRLEYLLSIPGQVSKLAATFDEPGEYNFICHEYCGLGHAVMYGTLTVES